jgi:hypothetical protein
MVASFSPSQPAMRERMSTPGPPPRTDSMGGPTGRTVRGGLAKTANPRGGELAVYAVFGRGAREMTL